jgi:hypothetical protein
MAGVDLPTLKELMGHSSIRPYPQLHGLALLRQRSRPSGQAAQTSAKDPVEPFDEI